MQLLLSGVVIVNTTIPLLFRSFTYIHGHLSHLKTALSLSIDPMKEKHLDLPSISKQTLMPLSMKADHSITIQRQCRTPTRSNSHFPIKIRQKEKWNTSRSDTYRKSRTWKLQLPKESCRSCRLRTMHG